MSKFLYEVAPKIPIKDLVPNEIIRRERIMELAKEEVLHCLKYGSVTRKFANQNLNKKVTLANIDQLHQAVYSEDVAEIVITDNTIVEDAVLVTPTPEVIIDPADVVEDIVETTVDEVTEDVVEESTVAEDETPVVDEVTEDVVEEAPVVDEVTETPVVEEPTRNPRNNNKKK